MKILFYGTKSYDEQFFNKIINEYPKLDIHFTDANIHKETVALAEGFDAICAFVNADLGTESNRRVGEASG